MLAQHYILVHANISVLYTEVYLHYIHCTTTATPYRGPGQPIKNVVLIANGLGIVPMLQMVRELLPSRTSSVTTASVIWLNERADDFCLYSELESAFYKYHRKLDVACIIERDLFGHALASNVKLRESVPPYRFVVHYCSTLFYQLNDCIVCSVVCVCSSKQ
jgi:hypothetical protein